MIQSDRNTFSKQMVNLHDAKMNDSSSKQNKELWKISAIALTRSYCYLTFETNFKTIFALFI